MRWLQLVAIFTAVLLLTLFIDVISLHGSNLTAAAAVKSCHTHTARTPKWYGHLKLHLIAATVPLVSTASGDEACLGELISSQSAALRI